MPLDSFINGQWAGGFIERAIWYATFVWWPRRCWISGRWLWLCKAYKGTAMWSGPGTPIFEYHWVDKDQFLLARLRGTL
jgi:hypothetical protein